MKHELNFGRRAMRAALAALILAVMAMGLFAAGEEVHAAESGTAYLAAATPYYKHPVTGKIEDPGQNEGIGQGMTESVLYKKALVEITDSGKTYATVRFYMMDNISKVKFWAQNRGASGWSSTSYQIMQENIGGKYCSDFRVNIPSKTAIVKARMYVSAMGRNVIFYMNFSNLKEGHGNFITSVSASTKSSGGSSAASGSTGSSGTQAAASAGSAADTAAADDGTGAAGDGTLDDTQGLTTSQDQTQEAAAVSSGSVLPALSWVLVLQCVLIILVPALIVGAALMGLLIYIKNREEIG